RGRGLPRTVLRRRNWSAVLRRLRPMQLSPRRVQLRYGRKSPGPTPASVGLRPGPSRVPDAPAAPRSALQRRGAALRLWKLQVPARPGDGVQQRRVDSNDPDEPLLLSALRTRRRLALFYVWRRDFRVRGRVLDMAMRILRSLGLAAALGC